MERARKLACRALFICRNSLESSNERDEAKRNRASTLAFAVILIRDSAKSSFVARFADNPQEISEIELRLLHSQ